MTSVRAINLTPTLDTKPHVRRVAALTFPGILFVVVTLFLALGAINGQNNLLFWLFGFCIAALVVSGIITGNALMGLKLAAHTPPPARAGQPIDLTYTVQNTARLFPNFALEITEFRDPKSILTHKHLTAPGVLLHLPQRAIDRASSTYTPTKRGIVELDRIWIRSRFPFGLFTKTVEFSEPRTLVIAPPEVSLDDPRIETLTQSEEAHNRHIARRGAGLDYIGLREYRPGDPMRVISWKRSAKSNALLVVEYPQPASETRVIELAPPTQDTPDNDFEHAIALTYTLIESTHSTISSGLDIPWAHIAIPPGRGPAHLTRCARALAALERPDPSSEPTKPPRSHDHRTARLVIRYNTPDPT